MVIKTVKTICFECHSRCGVILEVENGKIVNIKGDKDHPFSHGYTCPKARAVKEIIYHSERLTHPLRRIGKKGDGKFEKISWEEALDIISEKLISFRDQFGPESVVFGQGTTRGNPPWINRFLTLFGSPNYSAPANYSLGPIMMGMGAVCGTFHAADFASSKCIVLWGHNPEQSFPGRYMYDIRKSLKAGARLIVVDPRGIPLTKKADHWLQVRPGTDVALILCFINLVIKNELYDRNFIEEWTFGFDQLREHVSKFTPNYCAEITWIPADKIEKAIITYANTKPASIMPGIGGACHSINSFDLSRSLAILAAITGNLGIRGGNFVYYPPTGNRWCYGRDFSLTVNLPKEQVQKKLGIDLYPLYQLSDTIPPEFIFKAILEEKPYPVKAWGLFANNIMCAFGNSQYIRKALETLEFLFSVDYFHTPTTKMADIVLPAAHWTERDDVEDLGMENYIICQPRAVEPVPECRCEKEILIDLAERIGLNSYWKTVEEGLDYRLEPIGMKYEEFKKAGKFSVPVSYNRLKKKIPFLTPTGKVMLYTKHLEALGIAPLPDFIEPPESPLSTPQLWQEYPLILTTGFRILPFYHSSLRNIPSLHKLAPDPELLIHPETAKNSSIKDGEWVYLSTPRGQIEIKAKYFKDTHPKVVHTPHGYWYGVENGWKKLNINILTDNQRTDPVTASIPLKGLLCRVEKI
ncbi:MAG: molybdopterin-dependent oxidoreductase [Candidatus Hodarchaeota archaeon]